MAATFVVENVPGANGMVASAVLARSAPDGQAIMILGENVAYSPFIYSKPTFDPLKDIQMFGTIAKLAMGLPSSFTAQVKAGKLRPLAVSAAQRLPGFPEVPTLVERGFQGVEYESWYGLFVAAGTPVPVQDRLHAELGKVLQDKEFVATRLVKIGMEPFESASPATAASVVKTYYERLGPVVKRAGMKME